MKEKVRKIVPLALVAVVLISCALFSPAVREVYMEALESWGEEYARGEEAGQEVSWAEEDKGKRKLPICLPQGTDGESVKVRHDYVTRTIYVTMPEGEETYVSSYPPAASSSYIDRISYGRTGKNVLVEIVLDKVYELETAYDENNYYLQFLSPKEVYDKVVVVDAGHGGKFPGTTQRGIYEKDINLAILLELQDLFEKHGEDIGVYYTRTDDSNPTFEQRVQLANKSEADLFVSIHNNALEGRRMSSVKGTQVMYSETSEKSKEFAQVCLSEVTGALNSEDKGLVAGDGVYIIGNSKAPVALVEIGFMTNPEELALLKTESYQRQAAEGVYAAVLKSLGEETTGKG